MIKSLKKRGDFLKVKDSGRKFVTKHFLVNFLESIEQEASTKSLRLGISITKKIDKRSARRNRLRRRIKEIARAISITSHKSGEIVVVGRAYSTELQFQHIKRELEKSFRELRIIK